MKTTVKPVIKEKEKLKDGTVNVKLRVTHRRAVRDIATDYYVLPKYFDQDNGRILPGGDKTADDANRANNKIAIDRGVMLSKIDAQKDIKKMDIATLMTILRDKRNEYELLALMDERIKRYERSGNVNYKGTFKQTKTFIENNISSTVSLDSVSATWLTRLEYKMRSSGMKSNSIGVHMRNIRTVYNQAITMGLVDLSSYPFRKYHIPKEPTRKRNLTALDIAKIYRLKIDEPLMRWARDMFMLSFFLIGINMKDLMELETVEDGRIYYIRSKGKKPYNIKVWPEAQEIIDRYPGKKYLLDTWDRYSDYRTATKRINYKLKNIATLCKIDKEISTYWARHSWSVIGRSKEVGLQLDDISLGLGHQNPKLAVTMIYLDEDQEVIDIANRRVIDHILKQKIKKLPS